MPNKKRGIIFKTNNGDYAIGYYIEQLPKFTEQSKILVHIFTDLQLKNKKYDLPMLKSVANLVTVGFID